MSEPRIDRIDRIEEQIAHLTRGVEEMSEILRAQTARIERVERQLARLLDREAAGDSDTGASVLLGDQRPPHW